MANAAFVNATMSANNIYGSTSVTGDTPTYSAGDLIIALLFQAGGVYVTAPDIPSGWELLITASDFGSGGIYSVATRVASASEPSTYTFNTVDEVVGGIGLLLTSYSFSQFGGVISASVDDIEINSGTQSFPTAQAYGNSDLVVVMSLGTTVSTTNNLATPSLPGGVSNNTGFQQIGNSSPGYWAGAVLGTYLATKPGVVSPGSTTGNTNSGGIGNITMTLSSFRNGFFMFF